MTDTEKTGKKATEEEKVDATKVDAKKTDAKTVAAKKPASKKTTTKKPTSKKQTGTLGPYELRGELGRGAMAKVWRGWDPKLEREVAIKEPLFDERLSPDILEEMGSRFVKEGKAAARLNHPGIVTIYAADVYDSRPVIVMELIDGITLSEMLDSNSMTPQSALDALDQLLDAVGYAHKQGVVHRDIKPDNIFVTKDGRIKLSDFGIAHMDDSSMTHATQLGTVLGTPGYMAPEQAKGSAIDNRTDLFAIGTIAYEMLTGKNPFGAGDGTDATTLLYRIVHEPAPDLPEVASEGLPEDIRPGVLAALNKDPDDRPQDAASFKAMLHGAAAPAPGMKPASKPASTLAQQASSSANKKWLPYALVGGIGVVILIAVFAFATSGGGGGGGMVGSPTLMQQNAEDENSDFYLTIEDGKVVVYRGSLGDAASELEAITDIEASKLKPETISILEKGVPVTDTNTVEALLEAYSEEANRGLSIDMSVIDARIAASTGRHNVAVGVIDLSSGKTFLTDNANTQFEASGFYLPIVNTAAASGIGVSDDIPAVLYNQDNAAANSLINRIGGFAELNARLSSSGLRDTSYNRFFGDTSSSAENLTTAADAVESLRIIYDSGAYTSMPNELGSIGVVSPPGTVYAHRGIGIKTSVNTFAIVSTSKASYAVVVLTTGMGGSSDAAKAAATPLISDILSIVSSQVESSVG